MTEHVFRFLLVFVVISTYDLVVKRLGVDAVVLERLVKKCVRIVILNLTIGLQELEIELVNVFVEGIAIFFRKV